MESKKKQERNPIDSPSSGFSGKAHIIFDKPFMQVKIGWIQPHYIPLLAHYITIIVWYCFTFHYQPITLQSLLDIVLHSIFSPLHYNHCLILFHVPLLAHYITIILWYCFKLHYQPITLHYHSNKLDKGRIITLSRQYRTMICPLSAIGANNEAGLADGFILHPRLLLVVNSNKKQQP